MTESKTATARSRKTRIAHVVALAAPLVLVLSGCAQNFNANVKRFSSTLPAPAGQTFTVVASDPRNDGGLEFAQYANELSAQLIRVGYRPAVSSAEADLVVRFGYWVDRGQDRIRNFGGGFGGPWGGWGPWGGFGGPGFYRGGAWGFGWNDPFFFGGGFGGQGVDVVRLFQSEIDVAITRRGDGQRLFEGKAEAASRSNNLTYLVPNLVEAMFTGFPGNNGQTVRISIAPEKKVAAAR